MRHTKFLFIATFFFMFTIFTTVGSPTATHMQILESEITTNNLTIHLSDLPPYQTYYLNWTGHEDRWEFEYSPQNISAGADIEVEFEVPEDAYYMNFYLWSGIDGSYLDETSVIVGMDYSPKGSGFDIFGWWDPDLLIPLLIGSVLFVIGYTVLWFLRRGH